MTGQIINLPPDLEDFVMSNIENGRFESTTELVRAAIIALNREQTAAADKRVASSSSIAEGDVFRRLWEASPESAFSPSRR